MTSPTIRLTTSIQGVKVTTYTFDNNSNRTVEDANGLVTSYTYDNENRLVSLTTANNVITNTYSGDGLRRSTWQTGQTVHTMIWDGSDYLGEVH
ncbi:MAG TPA: RHS repeat domain-containing protein [Fimbriimonadaceae bacterium]|nr:RHS repeat domain-containing protein [Fimbriimonadaceae bacterium]